MKIANSQNISHLYMKEKDMKYSIKMVLISNSSHFQDQNCLIASFKIKIPFIAKKCFRICNLILLGHYESRSAIYGCDILPGNDDLDYVWGIRQTKCRKSFN